MMTFILYDFYLTLKEKGSKNDDMNVRANKVARLFFFFEGKLLDLLVIIITDALVENKLMHMHIQLNIWPKKLRSSVRDSENEKVVLVSNVEA